MKIAIESNDGETIKSPFSKTKGYLIFDVKGESVVRSEFRKKPIVSDCKTIISRGMDRNDLLNMKKQGMDVYITFNTFAQDALRAYLKEKLISSQLVH